MSQTDGGAAANCWPAPSSPTSGSTSGTVRIASRWVLRLFRFRKMVLAGLLIMTACGPAPQTTSPPAGEWHEFEGTWTAAGSRYSMRLGASRLASIANLNGSLLLAGPSSPAVGFRAEAIVLNDSVIGMVGRAAWTDDRGDQVYSELIGEGTATHNKIVGTFLGGTGHYAGATGTYEFSWRFVLEAEDGTVQGQSIGLKGRVRLGLPQGTDTGGGRGEDQCGLAD